MEINQELKEIGDYAFRDNALNQLDLKNVTTIGTEAFANNNLDSIAWPNVQKVGDRAFINNIFYEVTAPSTIESYGSGVFSKNERYVLIKTSNPHIQTEVVKDAFGQVVNPVTVTVEFVDQATGEKILDDQIIGNDFQKIDGLIFLNQKNAYTPDKITGYRPIQETVEFTPDTTDYKLTIKYENRSIKPKFKVVKSPFIEADGDGSEDVLKSFVTATDLDGNDLSAQIKVNPTTVDSSVRGPVEVTYQVTDANGNTATFELKVMVGTNWFDFELGKGWVLGDFTYDGDKVTGLSASGQEKIKTQKELILPHLNPHDGSTTIHTVAINMDDATSFRKKGLTSVADFAGNITTIEGKYDRYSGSYNAETGRGTSRGEFSNNKLTSIDLKGLEYVGKSAFQNNQLEKITFPSLKVIGASAFAGNNLKTIEENDLPNVEKLIEIWNFGSGNKLTKVHMPRLVSIESTGFIDNPIADAYMPKLEMVGPNTFAGNKLTEVTPNNFPSLKVIDEGAFRNGAITKLELPLVEDLGDGFRNNPITEVVPNFPKLKVIRSSALANKNISEITAPVLEKIESNAFYNNPGSTSYAGDVAVWTDNTNLTSKENYLINPTERDEELVWKESDFVWDSNNRNRVLGFSSVGKRKFPEMERKLTLPARARIVGKLAFNNLGLVSVIAPHVEEVEEGAFFGNNLTNIDDAFSSLKVAGDLSFAVNGLTELSLPALETTSYRTFFGNKLTKLNLPNALSIGEEAFERNPIKELYLPKVKVIEQDAFTSHQLKELSLPSVERIGVAAFSKVNSRTAGANRMDPPYPDRVVSGYGASTLEKVDLPNVKEIGDLAFAGNKIAEINITHVQTIRRKAFHENKISGDLVLPDVQMIGPSAFARNALDNVHVKDTLATLDATAFDKNVSNNKDRRPVFVFIEGRENPHHLEDGYTQNVRQHIINPTQVTVKHVDTEENELAESVTEYILSEKTYSAYQIFNYAADKESKVAPDNRQENVVKFVYTKLDLDEKQTQGIEIWQDYETDLDSGNKKTHYKIGELMTIRLYMDLTGFDSQMNKGKLKVYFDPKYIDPESISMPSSLSVERYDVKNTGIVEISLKSISGGFQLELPINWRFRKYVTPMNYPFKVNSLFENDGEVLSVSKLLTLSGYYDLPRMEKGSPINTPSTEKTTRRPTDNGPRIMGTIEQFVTDENTYEYKVGTPKPVRYDFTINGLERNVDRAIITDTLPTYIAVNKSGALEERVATFDLKLNPAWALSNDGKTVSQTVDFPATVYPNRYFAPLYLSYPDLKAGYNVENHAQIDLRVNDKGAAEKDFTVSDSLSIYTAFYTDVVDAGRLKFEKNAYGRPHGTPFDSYFYDVQSDREKTIPFLLRITSSSSRSDLKEVTLTDYKLDDRLYYSGVSFPRDSHTANNIPVSIVAYQQLGDKMNPANDKILHETSVEMSEKNEVVFDESYAKEIDYVQIILPEKHKVFSALEFLVNTKLKDPNKKHYIPGGLKSDNVFKNHAVMSGNLYEGGTDTAISKRGDVVEEQSGVLISKYDEAWDNLAGNLIWGVRDQVSIREYQQQASVRKTQTYSSSKMLFPGDKGSYNLSVVPHAKSVNGHGEVIDQSGENYHDFEMVDLLPKGIIPTKVTLNNDFIRAGGSWTLEANYNGTGREALVFKGAEIPGNIRSIATIDTEIDYDVEEGYIKNEVYWNYTNDAIEKVGYKKALPGTDNEWLYDDATIRVQKASEMSARKSIRKAGELMWMSTGIQTQSEEAFDYRLSLYNNRNTPRKEIDVVDVLPYVGDQSIQELNIGTGKRAPRESEFENSLDLDRTIEVPDGYEVLYWNSDTPMNYQGKAADETFANLNWPTTPAKNTRAIRIRAKENIELAPNSSLHVIIPMKAPKNTVANDFDRSGQRAYNTFVRKDAHTVRFVEPNRVYNELGYPRGSISFNKYGHEGKHIATQDLEKLEGAIFELYTEDGELVGSATSDAKGHVRFDDLDIKKTYTLKEAKAPEGYQLSKKTFEITYEDFKKTFKQTQTFDYHLTDAQEQDVVNIKPIYGTLKLEKVNGENKPLENVRFHLVGRDDADRVIYDKEHFTDRKGQVSVNQLPEGKYTLTEVKDENRTGYVPAEPREFVIDKTHRAIEYLGDQAIVNRNVQLIINKVEVAADFDLTTSLKDFTNFGLKKLDGYRFVITEVANPTRQITTGPTVKGVIKVEGLKVNTLYEIEEQKQTADPMHAHNPNKYRFMINDRGVLLAEDGSEFRQNIVNFPNAKKELKGRIQVIKVDNADRPLEGAVFGLYDMNDELLREATTTLNADGKAQVIFDELTAGTYKVKEIRAPKGYVKSETVQTVVIPKSIYDEMMYDPTVDTSGDTFIKTVGFTYHNQPFELEIVKGDTFKENVTISYAEDFIKENPEYRYRRKGNEFVDIYLPLEGVEFELYQDAGNQTLQFVQTLTTDAEGHLPVADVEWNQNTNYILIETKAKSGYKLDKTPIELNLRNLSKLETFDGTIYRYKENTPERGRIIISKYDQDNRQILSGAKFGLYEKGNLERPLQVATTNQSGYIEFKDLKLKSDNYSGEYVVKEIQSPKGYQLLNQSFQCCTE